MSCMSSEMIVESLAETRLLLPFSNSYVRLLSLDPNMSEGIYERTLEIDHTSVKSAP
jgi:hypothetical protein